MLSALGMSKFSIATTKSKNLPSSPFLYIRAFVILMSTFISFKTVLKEHLLTKEFQQKRLHDNHNNHSLYYFSF